MPTDAWEVEQGYVVRGEDYALPDPGLTDEERAALWLAAQVVRVGGQAPDPAVLFKLGGGTPAFTGAALGADIGGAADGLADLFTAVTEARLVGFTYRDKPRRVRPYGLVHRRGHWYLVGLQSGEKEARSFRVDRLSGLQVGSRPGAFTRPPGFRAGRRRARRSLAGRGGRPRGRPCASTRRSPGGPAASWPQGPPWRRSPAGASSPASRWRRCRPSSGGWWGSRMPPRSWLPARGAPRPPGPCGGSMTRERTAVRLSRLLGMLPWVIAHPGAEVSEVCSRFGYTRAELARDLAAVFVSGLPGYGPGDLMVAYIDGDEVVVDLADYFARPVRLTAAEGLALLAAGMALASSGAAPEALPTAVAKLAAVLVPDDGTLAVGLPAAAGGGGPAAGRPPNGARWCA